MALITDLVGSAVRTFNRDGTVTAVADLADCFRRIEVELAGKEPEWAPGHKVQFHLSGVTYRTFTPFAEAGRTASFLIFRAGHGPATEWADRLEVGSTVSAFGPRGSLKLDLDTPPVMVGDETSFALAAAWMGNGREVASQVYEVGDQRVAAAVLKALGVDACDLVERADGDGHHDEVATRVIEAVQANPGAPLVLTGRAQTIRAVRGALKDAGLSPQSRVKAYWDSNRSGLD